MSYEKVEFERVKLYEEVWTTPISRLAPLYGLSDVGLRKICNKLRVPVPPVGHWARVAHGKPVSRTPLPPTSDATTYVHVRASSPENSIRDAMVAAEARSTSHPESNLSIRFQDDPQLYHPLIRRVRSALKRPDYGSRSLWWTPPGETFRVFTSQECLQRSLRILNAFWNAVLALGAEEYVPAKSNQHRGFKAFGEVMNFALTETTRRVERPLTPEEARRLKSNPNSYVPDRYSSAATGKLSLVVYSANWYERRRFTDGRKPLEDQLPAVLAFIQGYAAEIRVDRELAAEQRKRDEEARRVLERRREIADKELQRLREFEQEAEQYERAERLRTYATALERLRAATSDEASSAAGDQEDVEWIRAAADWLDPLVARAWPLVDEAPAPYWWRDYQQKHGVSPHY